MIYEIRHVTHYHYDEPVKQCYNVAWLAPRQTPTQRCLRSQVTIHPTPASSSKRTDYFGNTVHHFAIQDAHQELKVMVNSRVEIQERRSSLSFEFGNSCQWALEQLKTDHSAETLEALEFLFDSPMVAASEELAAYAQPLFEADRPLLAAVGNLTRKIFSEFQYDPGFTTVTTPLVEVMEHRRGVCQDFAHLAIGCLRSLGYPARYVSGYLETVPPPGKPKLEGADATHAWLAVYSPGEGWVEFDPTNNLLASEQHITTAWGRDYSDVTPVKGVIFGGGEGQRLEVKVDVKRAG